VEDGLNNGDSMEEGVNDFISQYPTLFYAYSFWWEAKKTKPFLVEILKGTEQQPARE
jgi:hypothetical protein